ncbi:MAG: hypothetical protein ACK40X_03275 [Armatimonadota bacterium]
MQNWSLNLPEALSQHPEFDNQWRANDLMLRTNCGWRISVDALVKLSNLPTNFAGSNSR